MRIAVLGAGSWGTALAGLLADAGHDASLWARDAVAAVRLAADRENRRYLPGRTLPPSVGVTSSLADAVTGRAMVVCAVPSEAIRGAVAAAAAHLASAAVVVCAAKGLESGTRLTMDRVIAEVAPDRPVVLVSGPTFAAEVAQGLPAAAVAASRDPAAAREVQRAFGSPLFRVYTTDDVVGVALGGALKNVIAIAVGGSDGLGFGNNARAALITRGLSEVSRLGERMGAHPLTLAGLAGLGDLVLTCTGELSRNRRVGLGLGRGEPLPAIMARLGQVAEGIGTSRTARDLAAELGVDMPITRAVASVLHDGVSTAEALAALLARETRPERG